MKTALLLLILLFNTTLNANYTQCNEEGTQMQMNQCAYEEFQKADKELNKVYKTLLNKKKDDKIYLQNLKTSQRLWIKFRDAELAMIFSCESDNKRECFGSMYSLLLNSEKTDITQQRVDNLRNHLRNEEL